MPRTHISGWSASCKSIKHPPRKLLRCRPTHTTRRREGQFQTLKSHPCQTPGRLNQHLVFHRPKHGIAFSAVANGLSPNRRHIKPLPHAIGKKRRRIIRMHPQMQHSGSAHIALEEVTTRLQSASGTAKRAHTILPHETETPNVGQVWLKQLQSPRRHGHNVLSFELNLSRVAFFNGSEATAVSV